MSGIYFGGSSGLAKHFPERLNSLIVDGIAPHGSLSSTEPSPFLTIFERGVQEGVDAVIEGMKEYAGTITPQYEVRLHELDFKAMFAYMK